MVILLVPNKLRLLITSMVGTADVRVTTANVFNAQSAHKQLPETKYITCIV